MFLTGPRIQMYVRSLSQKREQKMKKSMMKKMREMPMFPLMPILPLAVMVTLVSFSILNYCGVKRLEEKLNKIYPSRSS